MKRPSFQFYPGDWQRDAALRSCSMAARGIWIEVLCLMHAAEPYGVLVLNGKPIDSAHLARIVGAREKEVARLLAELEAVGVFSRDAEGRIFSRRMVRDERVRSARAEGGKLGGNPALLGTAKVIGEVGDKVDDKVNLPPNLQPTPSSSSSSSSSKARAGNGSKPAKRERGTPCPQAIDVSDEMAQWAANLGVPADSIHAETERFLLHHQSKGSTFEDWNAAWRTWMHKAVEFARARH